MPKADQFAVGLALITTSLAALLSVHSLAYGALFLGLYLVCNPFIQDYFWGEYRPSLSEINELPAEEYKQNLNPKFDRWVKHISKPHPIKWGLLIPVFLVLMVIGVAGLLSNYTHKPSDQWVLKSYSADRGYTLEKNGVQYEAHCRGAFPPVLSRDGIDLSAGLVPIPPNSAVPYQQSSEPESHCSAVLLYLHKPVPVRQFGDILMYVEKADGPSKSSITELTISAAR